MDTMNHLLSSISLIIVALALIVNAIVCAMLWHDRNERHTRFWRRLAGIRLPICCLLSLATSWRRGQESFRKAKSVSHLRRSDAILIGLIAWDFLLAMECLGCYYWSSFFRLRAARGRLYQAADWSLRSVAVGCVMLLALMTLVFVTR